MRGGPQFRGWDESRYLQAAQVNATNALTYMFILANKDPKKPKPKPPAPCVIPDALVKKKQPPKPGSFAYIAQKRIAGVKKLKEGKS